MSQGKIVLMACGSFSPPTYMHLRMFEIARDYIHSYGLGNVIGGIMSPVHDAYGKKDLIAAHHRIAMLQLGLKSSWIKVSEWETQQTEWTRTKVSLEYHQNILNLSHGKDDLTPSWLPEELTDVNNYDAPDFLLDKLNANREAVTVKLLCGADLLESFAKPGLWSDEDMEAIVGRHGLVVVTRAGGDPSRFIYESDMLYKYRKNITIVTNYVVNDVSSTVIRRLIRRGESAKYLTDDNVLAYIQQKGLYASDVIANNEYIYNDITYDKKSPQDIIMSSPEDNYKNILISIRDKPSIVDETISVKRPRKNFLMPEYQTDYVSPVNVAKHKMAFIDKVPSTYVPGKAVKIVTNDKNVKDKVNEYSSLESCLKNDDHDYEYDLYKRRISEGNVDPEKEVVVKKRCSSTIRKLNPDDMKKSKSEVSKLCDKVKSLKLKEKNTGRDFKTRSCNDIVRLILTKHGIHVISDTEAIV